ncbi:MAG: EamA family transporter [Anaerolineae bacterium]
MQASSPVSAPAPPGLAERLAQRGISRRQFLKFCGAMAGALALPPRFAPRIASALAAAPRVAVVWLEFQDCAGNTESFLRASDPTVTEIVLKLLSVNYHETIMAPAGRMAEKSLMDTLHNSLQMPGQFIAVVEGAIPLKDGGVYCTVAGQTGALSRMGVGAIVMWGFLIFSGRAGAALTLSGTQWIWVLLTSVLLSGYVWTWYRALQTAPATVVTSVTTIGAVLTVGLSIVLEGKPTTGLQVAGSALLISGCLLFLWRQLRALPRAEAAA